jgi:single-stranded DNA-binding protein
MINVEPFKAKLVRNPEVRETKKGRVCNLRVRQIDPGKSSVFLDVAVFGDEAADLCGQYPKGTEMTISGGLIYNEWEAKPKGKGKPQKRSKHSLIADSVEVIGGSVEEVSREAVAAAA